MAWLDIAGGAAQGYVKGDQDIMRRREFEAMQNQRKRLEQQQKIDDTLTEKLKGVRPEGEYTDMVPQGHEAETDFMGPVGPQSGAKKVTTKVTAPQAARERAKIYAGSGRLQDMQAYAQQQALASQLETAERTERDAKNRDALMQAGTMIAMGNHNGAVRYMSQRANQMPELEGRQFVVDDRNGVPHLSIAENGRFISPPRPITPQVAQEMYKKGVDMLSPENMYKREELGLKKEEVGIHKQVADTAARKADYEIGILGPAQIKHLENQGIYLDRHGRAQLMEAQARVAANKKLTPAEKAEEIIQTYAPIIREAFPGMPEAQVRLKAAQVAFRDPNAKAQPDAAIGEYYRLGGKLYKPDAKGNLQEARLPGDTKQLADKMASGLGADDDGRPSITEPNSNFRQLPTPSVTRSNKAGAAPISPAELDDWVPQLTQGMFGIGKNRSRVNRLTGETIPEDEFERRTAQ